MKTVDQLVGELKDKKWHYVHQRERSVFYQHIMALGVGIHNVPEIKFPYEIPFLGVDYHLSLGQEKWDILNKLSEEELNKNPNFLLDLTRDAYKLNDQIVDLALEIEKTDCAKLTTEELIKYWEQYVKLTIMAGTYVLLPLFLEMYLENQLKQAMKDFFPESECNQIFQCLTTPIKLGVVQQEEESILKIAVKKASGENIETDIQKHLREFSWLKNNKFNGNFYSEGELLERINKILESDPVSKLSEYQAKIKKSADEFNIYRSKFINNSKIITVIDTLQEAIYFRSWRTERYYRNAYFLRNFFAFTAQKIGLNNLNDIFKLKADEIIKCLKNGEAADLNTIKERTGGYVMYCDNQDVYILSGSDAEMIKKVAQYYPTHLSDEIRGMVAYPGITRGPARIILSMKELDRVLEGDILITPSTTPDFVPVLKKVRAIVTEEGGVLSHASVISRELHIPCIIGTKNATKVLKDGDLIEVDAKNGIVKII